MFKQFNILQINYRVNICQHLVGLFSARILQLHFYLFQCLLTLFLLDSRTLLLFCMLVLTLVRWMVCAWLVNSAICSC